MVALLQSTGIFLGVLLVLSVNSVQGFEGNFGSVGFEIKQTGKKILETGEDYEEFIKEINEYVKNSNPDNTKEQKLLGEIIKYKQSFIIKQDKLKDDVTRENFVEKAFDELKNKKELMKIKQKVAMDKFSNSKLNQDFDLDVMQYLIDNQKTHLIKKLFGEINKKYDSFDEFQDTEFLNQLKLFEKNPQLIKKFNDELKNKISKIEKSRDNYNDAREPNNYLRYDPDTCPPKYHYCQVLKQQQKEQVELYKKTGNQQTENESFIKLKEMVDKKTGIATQEKKNTQENALKNNAGNDPAPKDNGPKDNGPKDNGPKDNGPKDNGPKDNGPDDKKKKGKKKGKK